MINSVTDGSNLYGKPEASNSSGLKQSSKKIYRPAAKSSFPYLGMILLNKINEAKSSSLDTSHVTAQADLLEATDLSFQAKKEAELNNQSFIPSGLTLLVQDFLSQTVPQIDLDNLQYIDPIRLEKTSLSPKLERGLSLLEEKLFSNTNFINALNESFGNSDYSNLDSLTANGVTDLKTLMEKSEAISIARDLTATDHWTPLEQVVSFSSTVKKSQLSQKHGEEIYCDFCQFFELNDLMYQLLRVDNSVKDVELDHTISNQSENLYRSIVELVSNAIDANQMRGDSLEDNSVKVSIRDDGYTVTDNGIGMNPRVILEKLLIPSISGKDGTDTIGRFGVGFYTALTHLQSSNDSVKVTTNDGNKTHVITFQRKPEFDNKICINIESEKVSSRQGTSIEVNSSSFDSKHAEQLLKESFKHNLNANILLKTDSGSELVNDVTNYKVETYESKNSDYGDVKILYAESGNTAGGGEVHINMNGVRIESLKLDSLNIPSELIIDFPLDCKVPESRSELTADKNCAEASNLLIKGIEETSNFTQSEKIQIVNALHELISSFEERSSNLNSGTHFSDLSYIAPRLLTDLEVLPNTKSFAALNLANTTTLVNPELIPSMQFDRAESIEFINNFDSNIYSMYTADFKDSDEIFFIYKNSIFLNHEVYEVHKDEPEILNVYLSNLNHPEENGPNKGRISLSEESVSDSELTIPEVHSISKTYSSSLNILERVASLDYVQGLHSRLKEKVPTTRSDELAKVADVSRNLNSLESLLNLDLDRYIDKYYNEDLPLSCRDELLELVIFKSLMPTIEKLDEKDLSRLDTILSEYGFQSYYIAEANRYSSDKDLRIDTIISQAVRAFDDDNIEFTRGVVDNLIIPNKGNQLLNNNQIIRQLILGFVREEGKKIFALDRTFTYDENGSYHRFASHDYLDRDFKDYSEGTNQLNKFTEAYLNFVNSKPIKKLSSMIKKETSDRYLEYNPQAEMLYSHYRDGLIVSYRVKEKLDINPAKLDILDKFINNNIDKLNNIAIGDARRLCRGLLELTELSNEAYQKMLPITLELALKHIAYEKNSSIDTSDLWLPGLVHNGGIPKIVDSFEGAPDHQLSAYFEIIKLVGIANDSLDKDSYNEYRRCQESYGIANNILDYFIENRDSLTKSELRSIISDLKSLYLPENRFSGDKSPLQKVLGKDRRDRDYSELPSSLRPLMIYALEGNRLKVNENNSRDLVIDSDVIRLSDFFQAKTLRESSFREMDNDSSINQIIQEVLEEVPDTEEVQRLIAHAINNQEANDPFLWIRELAQNSIDAITTSKEEVGSDIRIDFFSEKNENSFSSSLVTSFEDEVGMSLNEVFNYLLVPGDSSKDGVETTGKFGQGFFTVFQNASEVRVKTSTGDGMVTYLNLIPLNQDGEVVKQGEKIADVAIKREIKEEDYKGTRIEKVSNSNLAKTEIALLKDAVIKHTRFVDANEVKIICDNQQINSEAKYKIVCSIDGLGDIKLMSTNENSIVQKGLYIMPVEEELFDQVPEPIRVVLRKGLAIDIPKKMDLIKSRSDIAQREINIPIIKEEVPELSARLFFTYLANNDIPFKDLDFISYDYFDLEGHNLYQSLKDDELKQFARTLLEGEEIDKAQFQGYSQSKSQLESLVLNTPYLDYCDKKVSLIELNEIFREQVKNKTFSVKMLSTLPGDIANKLNSSYSSYKSKREPQRQENNIQQYQAPSYLERARSDFKLSSSAKEKAPVIYIIDEMRKALHEHLDIADNYQTTYYYANDGSEGHAVQGSSSSSTNLASGSFGAIAHLLSRDSISDEDRTKILENIICLDTHEAIHAVFEQPGDITHNAGFFQKQRNLLHTALKKEPKKFKLLLDSLISETNDEKRKSISNPVDICRALFT